MADQPKMNKAATLRIEHLDGGSWSADINYLKFTLRNPESLTPKTQITANSVKLKGTEIDLRVKVDRQSGDNEDWIGLYVFTVNNISFVL